MDGFRSAAAARATMGVFDMNPQAKWQRTSDIFFL
jgi:hypothetical protein